MYSKNMAIQQLPGGSNIEAAVSLAINKLKDSKNQSFIILISDGEELQGSYKNITNNEKAPILALGLGDPNQASFIQINGQFILDSNQNKVTTKLNDTLMMGPDALGHFHPIAIKSIHRKR